jgi:hypothetical protein
MPKCFLTGVEIDLETAHMLDLSAARHLLRDLRQRVASLERLIDQLGKRDIVEVSSPGTGPRSRKDCRLISKTLAEALCSAFPERTLFIPWRVWRSRWHGHMPGNMNRAQSPAKDASCQTRPGETGSAPKVEKQ